MNEKEIYKKVLQHLYDGLNTDNFDKFKNDRLTERKFAIGEVYPDIILTKKNSNDIEFIIEIVIERNITKFSLIEKWKPLSESGPRFYLLVPKKDRIMIEKWCDEEKMKVRFGTYEFKNNELEIKFY